ncbi:PqqD family protein [Halioglobus maricola]|uniref:PqqD family protein n=1 Tax=Halioglobus maricola TaxID=2601894 RepID=A0A5P9NFP6_9GAMM|nr:PqqD family protein [Halioglobus maricola]QFU74591.1 PqqD family protein [Halioglobus maricola]
MTDLYGLSPAVRFREVAGEGVMVQLDSGQVAVVNELGLRILQLLDEPQSVTQLGKALSAEYEVSLEQAEQDARTYLDTLLAQELVVNC